MTQFVLSQSWWQFVLMAVICYFVGCFNFAVLISHLKKDDIRKIGSGNPGTMNMTRTYGLKVGVINFVCDGLKGGIPVLVVYFIYRNSVFEGTNVLVADFARYFCGTFVVIGHIFPITMRFKGGKGIASTLVVFSLGLACENWWFLPIAICLLAGIFYFIKFFEMGSMGSLMGVAVFSIWQLIILVLRYQQNLANVYVILTFMFILALNLLTWIAHKKNLYKLMAGEEHHTSIKSKKKNKKMTA